MAFHSEGMAFQLRGRVRLQASTLAGAKFWDPKGADIPSMNWITIPNAHFLRWDRYAVDAMHQLKEGVGTQAPPASTRWAENIQGLLAKIQALSLSPQAPRPERARSRFE